MPIKVEIGQFRPMDKGTLKGFFTLMIHPIGLKIIDCRYFIKGESRWFSFPQKEIKHSDGRKSEYIPILSFQNKEYLTELQATILKELDVQTTKENHEKSHGNQNQNGSLPFESSSDWGGESPF